MTFKEYKKIYGKDGYCSYQELIKIKKNSNPRSFRAINEHWQKAIWKEMEIEWQKLKSTYKPNLTPGDLL